MAGRAAESRLRVAAARVRAQRRPGARALRLRGPLGVRRGRVQLARSHDQAGSRAVLAALVGAAAAGRRRSSGCPGSVNHLVGDDPRAGGPTSRRSSASATAGVWPGHRRRLARQPAPARVRLRARPRCRSRRGSPSRAGGRPRAHDAATSDDRRRTPACVGRLPERPQRRRGLRGRRPHRALPARRLRPHAPAGDRPGRARVLDLPRRQRLRRSPYDDRGRLQPAPYITGRTSSTDFNTRRRRSRATRPASTRSSPSSTRPATRSSTRPTSAATALDEATRSRSTPPAFAYVAGTTGSTDFNTVDPIEGDQGGPRRVRRQAQPGRQHARVLDLPRRQRRRPRQLRDRGRLDAARPTSIGVDRLDRLQHRRARSRATGRRPTASSPSSRRRATRSPTRPTSAGAATTSRRASRSTPPGPPT